METSRYRISWFQFGINSMLLTILFVAAAAWFWSQLDREQQIATTRMKLANAELEFERLRQAARVMRELDIDDPVHRNVFESLRLNQANVTTKRAGSLEVVNFRTSLVKLESVVALFKEQELIDLMYISSNNRTDSHMVIIMDRDADGMIELVINKSSVAYAMRKSESNVFEITEEGFVRN